MDIENYERDCAEKKLLMKLKEEEEAVKDGEGWLGSDELKVLMGNKMLRWHLFYVTAPGGAHFLRV